MLFSLPMPPATSASHFPLLAGCGSHRRALVRSKAQPAWYSRPVEADFQPVDRAARTSTARAVEGEKNGLLAQLSALSRSCRCRAIPDFPHVNASIEGENLRVHGRIHLGIAVDLGPGGLMAPVIRDAQEMGVPALARAIRGVAAAARDGSIKPDDLAGGTYTISNSGTFGTLITAGHQHIKTPAP